MVQTKKQQLIDTPADYVSDTDLLETFYSEHLKRFCLMFNGKLFTYKTWNGFVNKRQYFIEKYKLTKQQQYVYTNNSSRRPAIFGST